MSKQKVPSVKHLDFNHMLAVVAGIRGSDLHLVSGHSPFARCDGELRPLKQPSRLLTAADTRAMALEILGEERIKRVQCDGFASVLHAAPQNSTCRVTVAMARGAYTITARLMPTAIPTLEECGLPDIIKTLLEAPNGLIVVSGPAGSGKTTTLYAMVDWLNRTRVLNIFTVENPIAIPMTSHKSIIRQQEVGQDVPDVAAGIAAAYRQDLDVIVIGEVENLDALAGCLQAAETGHLVIIQMQQGTPQDAVDRIVSIAPIDMQSLVRNRLAAVLRGIVTQALAPRVQGRGRQPVNGVLAVDDSVRRAIAVGHDIGGLMGDQGSVSASQAIAKLEQDGVISAEVAQMMGQSLLRR